MVDRPDLTELVREYKLIMRRLLETVGSGKMALEMREEAIVESLRAAGCGDEELGKIRAAVQEEREQERTTASAESRVLRLPPYFGARVTAIHGYVRDASTTYGKERKQSLRKAYYESCDLLHKLDLPALREMIERSGTPSILHQDQRFELADFLESERQLLDMANVANDVINEIRDLLAMLRPTNDDADPRTIVSRLETLKGTVCALVSHEAPQEGWIRPLWLGVAGTAVIVVNTAVDIRRGDTHVGELSRTFGSAILEMALSQ